MTIFKPVILLTMVAVFALSACSRNKSSGLLHLRSSGAGPDEFAILPTKPLVLPKSLTELPEPTLGSASLADPTPNLDATIVLGGNARSFNRSGVPASDRGLISAASRYGVASDIRASLAADDVLYRQDNRGRLLERLFQVSTYFSAYESLTLDNQAELRRLRRLGVRTPAAPPDSES